MNNKLRRVFALCFFMSLLLVPAAYSVAQQQNKGAVNGRIVDSQQKPVSLIMVSVEGTTTGSHTDDDGEYSLTDITTGDQTIVISGIGIKAKKVQVTIVAGSVTRIPDIEVNNLVELNEVSVIGKSEARKLQEQAYAVGVLDFKKAYNTSASLNNLLNNVSSVRIREDGGVGSNSTFSLNGFSGNQVKFFLDGIPMDNFGSSFNLSNISVNMAERVEIYKGVLPVSLGGDALGGAVNIISRKDANYLDASYSIGSFNTYQASVNGAYTDLKTGFTVRANTFFNYSDNNYKVFVPIKDLDDGQIMPAQWVNRFHDNYRSGGIRFETGLTNKSFADYLLAGLIFSGNDKDVQTGATMDAVYGAVKEKSVSIIPSIRYKKSDLLIEGLSLSLYGAYNSVNTFSIDTTSLDYNWLGESKQSTTKGERGYTDSKIKTREWLANANLNYMINHHQSVTLNNVYSSLDRKTFDKVNPDNEANKIPQDLTKNITGLGWQVNYDRWNTNVFGKLYHTKSASYKKINAYQYNESLEKIEDDKTDFGYGAAATYFIIPRLQAKLSYEQTYRLPESIEMFGDGLIQQPNPDLKPESSDNLNLGFIYEKQLKAHTLFFETNFIYRNTKDFIQREVTATANPTSSYINIGEVLTKGIEGGIKYDWKGLLHAGVNVTYQSIINNQKYEENTSSMVGIGISDNPAYKVRIPNIPYLFGHGDFGLRFRNVGLKKSELTVDYGINYVEEYYLSFPNLGRRSGKNLIPGQTSQDIAVGYSLQNGKYNIVLECTNLTDEIIYDNYKMQKPGRAFALKFRYFLK